MNNKLNLTDNEKRDIIKYLESGKPLPEKYRFLLFDTDREVELLWNGKTDEVENMVLPFQTIEHIDEPRSEDNGLNDPRRCGILMFLAVARIASMSSSSIASNNICLPSE